MKYRTISLNGQYSLVKYSDAYRDQLEQFKEHNYIMAEVIEKESLTFDESSQYQSYLIIKNAGTCIGGLTLMPSLEGNDLDVELYFESNLSAEERFNAFEQVVESLKLYFFDKGNLRVKINDDRGFEHCHNYERVVGESNNIFYICPNLENNILFSRLFVEMEVAEKTFLDWGLYWTQRLVPTTDVCDLWSPFNNELMNSLDKGTNSREELFYKITKVNWENIRSSSSTRNISFSRDGQIYFSKSPNKNNGINYTFDYNVLGSGFSLRAIDLKAEEALSVNVDSICSKIQIGELETTNLNGKANRKISCVTPIVNNSSIALEIWIDEEGYIEKCYIDFRIHKNNGSVKGIYALRIVEELAAFSLTCISRKGNKSKNLIYELIDQNDELFDEVLKSKISIDLLDELVRNIIPIINRLIAKRKELSVSETHFSESSKSIINDINESEKWAINFIKEIKGEIPLPILQERVEDFVSMRDKKKKQDKQLVL